MNLMFYDFNSGADQLGVISEEVFSNNGENEDEAIPLGAAQAHSKTSNNFF